MFWESFFFSIIISLNIFTSSFSHYCEKLTFLLMVFTFCFEIAALFWIVYSAAHVNLSFLYLPCDRWKTSTFFLVNHDTVNRDNGWSSISFLIWFFLHHTMIFRSPKTRLGKRFALRRIPRSLNRQRLAISYASTMRSICCCSNVLKQAGGRRMR